MKQKNVGARFEDFLAEEGLLDEARAEAIKFNLAGQLKAALERRRLTKVSAAKMLHTSRSGLDRILDPKNTSISLHTMVRVAQLAGKRIEISLK
ncbi:MAG: XRE family transcriptional regulator [Planctomycetota bacterium]